MDTFDLRYNYTRLKGVIKHSKGGLMANKKKEIASLKWQMTP